MVEDTSTTSPAATDGTERPTAAPDGPATDEGRDEAAAPRRPARWWVLPWLVAAVAVLVAMATTSQWLALRAEDQTRQEVLRAAEEFVVALMNWDATDGLEDTRDELRDMGTGEFLQEIDQTFGGDQAEAEEFGYVSVGDVQDVFIQRVQEDQAIALGVVVQTIRAEEIDVAERTVRSARITLVREDGRWLVSEVDVFAIDEGAGSGTGGAGDEETTP